MEPREFAGPIHFVRRRKTWITTDKPSYQPGQTIHLRSLSLYKSDLKPATGNKLVWQIEDSKGNLVFRRRATSDEHGITTGDFVLAEQVNTGTYTIRVKDGDELTAKRVRVAKYLLPKFKLSIVTAKPAYRVGERLTGTVTARYFFAKPVVGARGELLALSGQTTIARRTAVTDVKGDFAFNLSLPDDFAGERIELQAKLTDKSGRSQRISSAVPVHKHPILIEVIPAGRPDHSRRRQSFVYFYPLPRRHPGSHPGQARGRRQDSPGHPRRCGNHDR